MAKTELITSFTSGLLGAKLRGRADIDRYKSGCKTLTNMVVMPQGGATKRPGTKLIAAQKTVGQAVRLLPFVFSATDAFTIEMGVGYFRFYKAGAQILSGGAAYEIANTYTEAQLFDVTYCQSADIMYLFHQAHHPKMLSRYSDSQWSFTDINFEDGPYFDVNTTEITIDHGDMIGARTNMWGVAGGTATLCAVGISIVKGETNQGFANTSSNNISWVKNSMSGAISYNAVRFLNSRFIAVGQFGKVKYSTLGASWANVTTGVTVHLNDVCYDGTLYYFAGNDGEIYTATQSASPGNPNNTLTHRTSGVTTKLNGIAFDGTATVIAVGDDGIILKAAIGTPGTWVAKTSGTTEDLNGIYFDATIALWCVVGDAGTILTSADGETWAARTSGITVDLNGIMGDTAKFVVVGDDGYILTSVNGIAWTIRNHNKAVNLRAVAYLTGMYVAVGTQGMLATSIAGTTWVYRGLLTATITATDDIFKVGRDEGRHIRMATKGVWTWGKILTVTNESVALIDIRGRFYGEKSTDIWQLGAFYIGNYPKCGTLYQERLFLANSPLSPQTVWASCSADFINFAPSTFSAGFETIERPNGRIIVKESKVLAGEVVDSSSLTYVVGSSEMAYIQWMKGMDGLILGCTGGIFKIMASQMGSALTPSDKDCKEQGAVGTHDIMPVRVGSSLVYAQRIGKTIRELKHSSEESVMVSPNLSIICDEITGTGIVDMAYQQEPYSIVWMVTADGYLVGFTSDAHNKIGAWHYHTTVGTFESVACIPGTTEDVLYAVVKRGTTRNIEYMKPFDFGLIANIWFTDGGSTATNGNAYTAELSPMDLQPGGAMKRIVSAVVLLHETSYAKIGRSSTKCDITPGLTATALYSIDTKEIGFPAGYERDATIYIRSDLALPLTVLGIRTVWE
jgi:hypothetical protein